MKHTFKPNNVFLSNHSLSDNGKIHSQVHKISEMIKSEKELKNIGTLQHKNADTVQQHIINKKIICNVINPDDPSTIMVKCDNEIFSFNFEEKNYTLLNKNVKVINTFIEEFNSQFYNLIKDNEFISFICFNLHYYSLVKSVLYTIFIKIQNDCIKNNKKFFTK